MSTSLSELDAAVQQVLDEHLSEDMPTKQVQDLKLALIDKLRQELVDVVDDEDEDDEDD